LHNIQIVLSFALGVYHCSSEPGTAKVFFLSVEDERGIFNVIITPNIFEQIRVVITRCHFLIIEGTPQIADSVVHIKLQSFQLLMPNIEIPSHNFH
jgi:error-prone DNA polymerase